MNRHTQRRRRAATALGLALAVVVSLGAQGALPARPAPQHARAVKRLLIANAMVIYGNAKPAYGPMDILVEDGLIARVAPAGRASRPTP